MSYNYQSDITIIIIKYMGELFRSIDTSDKIDCINYFKENLYNAEIINDHNLVISEAKNLPSKRAIFYIYKNLSFNDRSIILNYSHV
jgi:hypothetical protein